MSFIKKILEKKSDESVHNQFVRFGKGTFNGRALIKFIKTKEVKISSSFEYANDFVELITDIVDKMNVSGIVLTKENISGIMKENNILGNAKTKRGGLYYLNNIDSQDLNQNQLKLLMKESYFTLLDIDAEGIAFKCKKKLPKPGKSEKKIDDKFCSLKADLKYWDKLKECFFSDFPSDARKGSAKHTFEIQNIIAPTGEKDYEKIRLLSKRAGKIRRILDINKNEEINEFEFEA